MIRYILNRQRRHSMSEEIGLTELATRTAEMSAVDILANQFGEADNTIYPQNNLWQEWQNTPTYNFQRLSYQALDRMIVQLVSQISADFKYPAEVCLDTNPLGDCPICLDSLQNPIIILECEHKYHADCIRNWKQNSCPYCRLPIDNNHSVDNVSNVIDLPID